MSHCRYHWLRALRPFSLCVALINCGLAIVIALPEPTFNSARALAVMLAGLTLQAGVNFINDFSDRQRFLAHSPEYLAIVRNAWLAALLFAVAALLGAYLAWFAGWSLVGLILLGAFGALGYTQEPINYKRRGLAVPLVFWLMGVLMVEGSYLAITGHWSLEAFWLSLPVSILTSLLLLSNELRDVDVDRQQGVWTLTLRLGEQVAQRLFLVLLLLCYLLTLVYLLNGWLSYGFLLLLSLPLLWPLLKQSARPAQERQQLPRAMGRFYLLYGVCYLFSTGL